MEPPVVGGRGATRGVAPRRTLVARNPTFGPDYWVLGLLAALPALLVSLVFLLRGVRLPRVPQLTTGPELAVLLLLLLAAALLAHVLDYPAWSQPVVVMAPTVALVLPAALLHGRALGQANGDPAPVVALGVLATWLLLLLGLALVVLTALVVGRHAPSFAGAGLAPLPLLVSWTIVLAPSFHETVVAAALASAFGLAALATFIAWVVPAAQRPFVPLLAAGVQFGVFGFARLGWPPITGAARPVLWLDALLFVALVVCVGVAPVLAAWVRQAGWPELRRLFD